MKKFISAVLSAAIISSCVSFGVYAEPTSTVYTLDTTAKTISNVKPLTTVAAFEANITGATSVDVVNVDGSSMADDAYATENVFAVIDGERYTINVKYPYSPVQDNGKYMDDGRELYNKAATSAHNSSMTSTGFNRVQVYDKLSYGNDNAGPANTDSQIVKGTKQTENGAPVYVMENNSAKYAFMRSDYSDSAKYSTTFNGLIDSWTFNPIITTVEFEADKEGNISLYNNTPVRDASKNLIKGDSNLESLLYAAEFPYAPNSVHFLEDGSVKLGGTYNAGYSKAYRTPIHETGFKWEPGKKYTVSVVQRYKRGARDGYIDGVYINGTKIFPYAGALGHADGRLTYLSDSGTYKFWTKDSSTTHGGGLSSILIGTAPKNADENLTVSVSDVKVYTVATYNPEMDKEFALENIENVTVSDNTINVAVAKTVREFKDGYSDVAIVIYNENGEVVADSEYLAVSGMTAKAVSKDGLHAERYAIIGTEFINPIPQPVSGITYTVDADKKTVSGVKPLTTVATFLANFDNGASMQVVNIDGSEMAQTAYATDHVSLKAPNGDLYKIIVKYPYSPVQDNGKYFDDGRELYNKSATSAHNSSMISTGFDRVQVFDKLSYGSDAAGPANTDSQIVKGTKQTENGAPVYVMENNSAKYAFMRSDYSDSTNYSTEFNKLIDTNTKNPIITTVEFEADKAGNISLYNNTPVRNGSGAVVKGDSNLESLLYSAEFPYAPNSVHFLEDGSVKLGGTYTGYSKAYRSPIHETDFTWEPGKKYTVSIVQRYFRGEREGYVDGVYVNGTKIFPYAGAKGHQDGRLTYLSDSGTYKFWTKDSSTTHGGGLSSILIGTAPKNADENLTVSVSDVKVYTVAAYNPAMDKKDIITNAENVSVSDNTINVAVAKTVGEFKADYPDAVICVYNGNGELAADDEYIAVSGMTVKAVTKDGLQGKTYTLNGTKLVSTVNPQSEVYTVDVDAKTVSNVKPLTTVAAFLANFDNGTSMQVVNIDGSVMADNAYATENVSLKAPNGDLYQIVVKYAYSPIQNDGKYLENGRELYNKAANEINNSSMTHTGFDRVQVYEKFGYGSDNISDDNTADQTVKATKQTIDGAPVYVMENDSNRFAYMRSDYSDSTNYSTDLNNAVGSQSKKQIVTTVEFEADKNGNISLFQNTPVRDKNGKLTKGDSGVDGLVYSVEAKYAPNSVHFLEDGYVWIGGIYANYDATTRKPIHKTSLQWEAGKKYTVSVVQRYLRGEREGYVDGVYVNGTKIFPYAGAESHTDGRVALLNDGTFKIGTKDSSTTHGGGLSSIMIGTAPETAGENLSVAISDVKVYNVNETYDSAIDKELQLVSRDSTVVVDNENGVIYAVGSISTDSFDTTNVKVNISGNVVKAVSADGLLAKTYTVEKKDINVAFLNGEDGDEITTLAEAGSSVCFSADIDESTLVGVTPIVVLAVYKGQKLQETIFATGMKYSDEVTRYKAVLDISGYNKSEIEIRGFAWNGFAGMKSLADYSALR